LGLPLEPIYFSSLVNDGISLNHSGINLLDGFGYGKSEKTSSVEAIKLIIIKN
jgi:hypothetical protein